MRLENNLKTERKKSKELWNSVFEKDDENERNVSVIEAEARNRVPRS